MITLGLSALIMLSLVGMTIIAKADVDSIQLTSIGVFLSTSILVCGWGAFTALKYTLSFHSDLARVEYELKGHISRTN